MLDPTASHRPLVDLLLTAVPIALPIVQRFRLCLFLTLNSGAAARHAPTGKHCVVDQM
jgi:hypothetical protein